MMDLYVLAGYAVAGIWIGRQLDKHRTCVDLLIILLAAIVVGALWPLCVAWMLIRGEHGA